MFARLFLSQAVVALLAYDVGAACTSSTLSGYTCQATTSGAVVHYTLAADKATVKLAVEASVAGYAALGVGGGMTTSQIILGYVSSGTATLKAITTSSRSSSGVSAGTVEVTSTTYASDASVTESGGKTVTRFTYNLAAGGKIADTAAANFAWAISPNDVIARHSSRGSVTLNLDESVATTSSPPTSAPPTPAPDTPEPGSTATPAPDTPAPLTNAPSTNAPSTNAPSTNTPSTSAPATETPPSCTASTLSLPSGEGTYQCVSQLDSAVSLHWSVLSGSRKYALRGTAAGYLAMGFPDTAKSMGPGSALIATGGSVAKYAISSGKTTSAVQQSSTVLTQVTDLTTSTVGGNTVMHWTETTTTTSRTGVVLSDVLSFNYAYHTSSTSLQQHTVRASVEVDLLEGSNTDTTSSSKEDKVQAHAVIQTIVWAFLVPLAVLIKRFGGKSVKVGGFPVPFIVHAVLMLISVILTICMVSLGLAEFDNGTEKAHKETGIVVMCTAIVQVLMQGGKPADDSPHRPIFYGVHAGLGLITMIIAYATLFTGAENYERLYGGDFADIRIVIYVSIGIFALFAILLTVHQLTTKTEEKETEGTAPDTTPDTEK